VCSRDLHANLAASASNGMTKLANTISAHTKRAILLALVHENAEPNIISTRGARERTTLLSARIQILYEKFLAKKKHIEIHLWAITKWQLIPLSRSQTRQRNSQKREKKEFLAQDVRM
jgi:hypothetical protein